MRIDGQIALVELPTSDSARSERFYEAVFGSSFRSRMVRRAAGALPDESPAAEARPAPDARRPPPVIPPPPRTVSRQPMIVLYARDIVVTAARIVAAGGVITRPVFEVKNGRRLHFQDPDGNELIVWSDVEPPPGERIAQKMAVPPAEPPVADAPPPGQQQMRAGVYVSVWLKYARKRLAEADELRAREQAARAAEARAADAEREAVALAEHRARVKRLRAIALGIDLEPVASFRPTVARPMRLAA